MIAQLVGVAVGLIGGVGAAWWLRRRGGAHEASQSVADDGGVGVPLEVLESHRTGVIVADGGARVVYRNASARALAGTHAGVLIDAAVERHLERACGHDGEGDGALEETIELYGPPKKVVDISARRLPGGGAVAFVEDISERHRIDQVRTDFVANVSHELKTPIGALSVLAETIADESDPTTLQRIAGRMLAEAERAARTVDDLMELSRIELAGQRADAPVELRHVLAAAVDRVAAVAERRAIEVRCSGPAELVVAGDRVQLESAVGNLVENAVQYSDDGSQVEVAVAGDGAWATVTVTDHGVGIPRRDLDRIFERFYRVDRARSRATGGTGLGLSIVRHVAANHGGEVSVNSTEGEGSTFVLRIPAYQEPQTQNER